ncbi:hypothetical protein RFI_16505 [Reticulomyxa filosa]|uniref:Uncharacterized protein n=1 Tax=Reticulomyxa filosa TaxID=46433 RepID=X6N473_RETFI|nr:hypothetical protein RFI_16505 [Reticulomyxa filosa]|eukprot:ETO20713.1 hypothetical protein RFI_16505 [Reticulomyxa filosa]
MNLALDESAISDIINGRKPDDNLVSAREKYQMCPYPVDNSGLLLPLKLLRDAKKNNKFKLFEEKNAISPVVILSIGANDVRKNLKYTKPDLVIEMLQKKVQFEENMEQIVKMIVNDLRFNLILVLAYEPHEDCFKEMLHFGREELLDVMEWTAVRMLGLASRNGLPLMDLSRTLNPFERTHYSKTPFKPSNQSAEMIADLIAHILENYDFKALQEAKNKKDFDLSTLSKIYYGIYISVTNILKKKNALPLLPPFVSISSFYIYCDCCGKKGDRNGIQAEANTSKSKDAWSKDLRSIAPGIATASDIDLLADLFEEPQKEAKPNNSTDNINANITAISRKKSGQKEEEEGKVPTKDRPRR